MTLGSWNAPPTLLPSLVVAGSNSELAGGEFLMNLPPSWAAMDNIYYLPPIPIYSFLFFGMI